MPQAIDNDPEFAVVFAVSGDRPFEIEGVFSTDEDAERFKAALNANPAYFKSGCVDHLTMRQIKTELAESHLKALGDRLFTLLQPMLSEQG